MSHSAIPAFFGMSFHHIYYNIFLGGSGTLVGEFTLLWDGEEVFLGSWRGVMVVWGRGFPRELEGSDVYTEVCLGCSTHHDAQGPSLIKVVSYWQVTALGDVPRWHLRDASNLYMPTVSRRDICHRRYVRSSHKMVGTLTVHIRTFVCLSVSVSACLCLSVCVCLCVCICIYVCMYVCMYVCRSMYMSFCTYARIQCRPVFHLGK